MKRLFLSAALLPLIHPALAQAETKISTATTAPVRTSTVANGQADNLTIENTGSIKPTAAGAAVTMDAPGRTLSNKGAIGFEGVNAATGVLMQAGAGGVTNSGQISLGESYTPADSDNDGDLDGPFAQGSNRFGIRATGAGAVAGDVRNEGSISVKGADSAGISLETTLAGSLVSSGAVAVLGDRTHGIAATQVAGDVRITGAVSAQGEAAVGVSLGEIGGGVVLQSAVTATGYRSTERLGDAARTKLDVDDLKQGGGAVRITGSVAKGVLLDRPPADNDASNNDEDDDGVADAQEGVATLSSFGSAPALSIGGNRAISLGAIGSGALDYGLVVRGQVLGRGVNDGVAATGLRIGAEGGGLVTVARGIHNQGGMIDAASFGAQATGLLINANAVVGALNNSGAVTTIQNGGKHDARAIVDQSGSLTRIDNSGVIRATVNGVSGQAVTGRAIAIDLAANTSGVVIRQARAAATDQPEITGDVLLGSGADRLELLGGRLTGTMNFGAGADTLILDGGALASVRLNDSDGQLDLDVRQGRLAVTNQETVRVSRLTVGAQGAIAIAVDPQANKFTRFEVAGAATLANGAKVDVALTSLLRGSKSFEILHAQSLQAGATALTLKGAPYLYQSSLRVDGGSVHLDLRPKTIAELGLNRSGAGAYSAVFDQLDRNSAIEAAFLSQTDRQGFSSLYDQMLPDHSGGALMSVAAVSSAVSSAVAAPMRLGEAVNGLWAQEIAFGLQRDRNAAAGYDADGFGLAAGVDALGDAHAMGFNVSLVSAEFKDQDAAAGERVAMTMAGGGVYWRMSRQAFQAHARAGLGYVWFDGKRRLAGPSVSVEAQSDWTGWTADAQLGASYQLALGRFYARPQMSLAYVRLSEGSHQEKGGGAGFDLIVDDRDGDLFTGEAVVALGARFGEAYAWSPEVTLGWRQRLAGEPGRTTARFVGAQQSFNLSPEDPFDGAAVARLAVNFESPRMLFRIEGGGAFEDGYQDYDLRAVLRYQF